ncbi:MAG TPA: TAXI family TRAP transporter solute-binding subunit [Burkholderiales bacterium]
MRSLFSKSAGDWRHARVIAACGIVLALALQACTVVQHRPDVVIGTGRPGGVYFPLGDSVCRMFNLDLPHRGLGCAANLSRGPVANIESLRARRVDIAIVQSDVLADAIRGEGPFASRGPDTGLRVLFTGQTEAFTIVARRELGIRRAPELRGKRINLGSPGSGERVSMERVMAALGFAPTDFAAARELPLAEQHDALCANELDAIVFTVRHPNGLVDDVVRTCRGVLVDVSGPPIDRLLSGHPEYGRFVIPGNTYISNPEDVATLGVWTAIITTTRLSDTVAYEITKAVFENIDDFRRLHPDFATLVPQDMVPGALNAPIHPGAVRYYRERGWLP